MAKETERELPYINHRRGLVTLSPLVVFFLIYVVSSLLAGDFYKMPVAIAFLAASGWAFMVCKPKRFVQRVERFSAGAAHSNIMMMIWIFILAGAFAKGAEHIGAVDAMVKLTLNSLPANMLLPGVFLAACLISLSIGTSVGTIVALMPVAAGLATGANCNTGMMAGAVVGGAFFGDNLSFISDTTIAATRTQGCAMRDKFRANFRIVLPAAIGILVLYAVIGLQFENQVSYGHTQYALVIPYLLVLVCAICGMNVMKVLFLGIAATGIAVLCMPDTTLLDWAGAMGAGITGMGELIIVTLLAAGMLELIRYNGGLSYIISHMARGIRGRRSAELSIGLMASLANLCTANNTVAIVAVGNIARRIAKKHHIPPARTASLLDTFSCVIQAVIPYGAQLLAAASLAGLSAMDIIPHLYYPFTMAACTLLFVVFTRKSALN